MFMNFQKREQLWAYILYGWFNLREQVDELDVGGEDETSRGGPTQVVLGVEQLELYQWTANKDQNHIQLPYSKHTYGTIKLLQKVCKAYIYTL